MNYYRPTPYPWKRPPVSMFKILHNIASFAQLQFNSKTICICSIKLLILVKISAAVTEMVFKSLLFSEACFLTFHEVDSDISIDCSPCPWDCRDTQSWNFGFYITLAMASKQTWSQPGGPCNPGQSAGARLLQANPWLRSGSLSDSCRSDPDLTTRLSVLQFLSGKLVCLRVWKRTEGILNIFHPYVTTFGYEYLLSQMRLSVVCL